MPQPTARCYIVLRRRCHEERYNSDPADQARCLIEWTANLAAGQRPNPHNAKAKQPQLATRSRPPKPTRTAKPRGITSTHPGGPPTHPRPGGGWTGRARACSAVIRKGRTNGAPTRRTVSCPLPHSAAQLADAVQPTPPKSSLQPAVQ